MNPPVYDDDEPPYMYIKKVEEYLSSLKKNKYMHSLDFINKLCAKYDKKYKSLCDFKNVSYLVDNSHNKKILKLHGQKTAKNLNIDFDFDELHKNSIFEFISIIVGTVGYSLINKEIDDKWYHTIIDKPPIFRKKKSR